MLYQLSYARKIRVGVTPPLRFDDVLIVDDLDHLTGTNGTSAFTDSETETLVHGDISDQLHINGDVVTRHYHLGSLGESDLTGAVHCTDVELRTILVAE